MTTRTPRRARQRRRPNSLLKSSFCLLSIVTFLAQNKQLPWPCLFASASITHRIASSFSQPSRTLVQQQFSRELDGQYAADDQYVNEGAYDDAAANEAMEARDEANEGDDGYLDMADVEFDEVSIMPVSCVN